MRIWKEIPGNKLRGTLPTANGSLCGIPFNTGRDVKFNPMDKLITRIGPNFLGDDVYKWYRSAMNDSGVMYCLPNNSCRRDILKIDMITFTVTELDRNLLPKQGNCMFHVEPNRSLPLNHWEDFQLKRRQIWRNIQRHFEAEENYVQSFTNFDHAVIKFGQSKVFEALEKSMEPINDFCKESNLCQFMIAASYKESTACAINNLLRHDLSLVNSWISSFERNTPKKKKIRRK